MTITEALGCLFTHSPYYTRELRQVPFVPRSFFPVPSASCVYHIHTPSLPLKALDPVTGGGWSVSYKSHRFAHFALFQIPIVLFLFFLVFQPRGRKDKPVFSVPIIFHSFSTRTSRPQEGISFYKTQPGLVFLQLVSSSSFSNHTYTPKKKISLHNSPTQK